MKVTTVSASFSSTINLGNFRSIRLEAGYEGELESGDDPAAETRRLFDMAQEEVKRKALPIVRKNNLELDEVFLNLPDDLQQQILNLVEENK